MKKVSIVIFVFLLGFSLFSCNKDEESSDYPVNIRMTDAPGPYEAVYIDLLEVEIKGNDSVDVIMDVNAGIYNLLDFSNGKDTLIAMAELEASRVEQIRLILGPNNTIVVDGETHPLSTPSAEQSGLKIQVHQDLEAGVEYSFLIDFDANKSIVKQGNGGYKLKPVLRIVDTDESGEIMGSISPAGTVANVCAESSGETYCSNVDEDGNFKIVGLPEGTYTLTVTPELPLSPAVKNNVVVTVGSATDVGTIILD